MMKVIIDGLNLENQKGTGIKTYTRSVINALHSLGICEINLLTEKTIPRIPFVDPVNAYIAELSQEKNKNFFQRMKKNPISWKIHKNNIELYNKKSEYLNEDYKKIKNLIVRPNIFLKSFIKSGLGFGGLKIANKSNADVFFLTSPIPIIIDSTLKVLTVHDVIPITHPWFVENWNIVAKGFGRSLNYLISRVDKIICMSEESKKELLKIFKIDENKIITVYQTCKYAYCNFETNPLSDNEYLELIGLYDKPYILYAGAIEPKKNLITLLEVVNLNKSLPKLVIVGPFGWLCEKEKRIIKQLEKENRVSYYGYLPDWQLEILQRNAKSFVFPSFVEGFGLPILESIWHGTPAVVSDIPVFRELFSDHVIYINQRNYKSIMYGIFQAMEVNNQEKLDIMKFARYKFSFENFKLDIKNAIEF